MNNFTQLVRHLLNEQKTSVADVAKHLGMVHSPSNMSSKFYDGAVDRTTAHQAMLAAGFKQARYRADNQLIHGHYSREVAPYHTPETVQFHTKNVNAKGYTTEGHTIHMIAHHGAVVHRD